ncbi:MAG: LamG-like jellyroll fold domain-containing protein [Bryobacterales bacterium]
MWLSGGEEVDGPTGKVLRWSQPEIALYDDDPIIRMSYPDLVEEGGKYYLTETQKDVARIHEIDKTLLEGLWSPQAPGDKPLAETEPGESLAPELPQFVERSRRRTDHGTEDLRAGFSLELWLDLGSLEPGQTLLDNRGEDGRGFAVETAEDGSVELILNDGRTENRWRSDRGALTVGERHHVVATVDGGPKIITFVVDGELQDGGRERQFGWGRFNPNFRSANGGAILTTGRDVERARIYGRALRTSEAVANFLSGK